MTTDSRGKLRDMLHQIEEARAHSSPSAPLELNQRLSDAGKEAADALAEFRKTTEGVSKIPSQSMDENLPMTSSQNWYPSSWTTKPIKQEVLYSSKDDLEQSLSKLEHLPPIVTPKEIVKLRQSLRKVAEGDAFLLQGGDCAELFSYCEQNAIDSKIKLLLQMSLVLIWGMGKPVVRIARMAGQYAKPRSSPKEVIDGKEYASFRGDILNGYDLGERTPDPKRLVDAYFHSSATMNHVRAQLSSGIADLNNPLDWDLGHVQDEVVQQRYKEITSSITESLRFMDVVGVGRTPVLETVDLFTSHEGLVLEYEQSLTRQLRHPPEHPSYDSSHRITQNGQSRSHVPASSTGKGWYNTSAHFLWIGDRTRQLDGGHVEFFRGLENPIGVKVGPSMKAQELVDLLDILDPNKEPGKVTLITRYGESKVEGMLGSHIDAVKASGHVVVWQCDPMHGNTLTTPNGTKTRRFSSILSEVSSALKIHRQHGSFLGGVHLELTGAAVTECVGGSEGLVEEDLSLNYTTYCDPRLNEKQALELAFLVATYFRGGEATNGEAINGATTNGETTNGESANGNLPNGTH